MISVEYIKKIFDKTVPCVLHKDDDKASAAKLCKTAIDMDFKKLCVKQSLYDFTFNCLDRKGKDLALYLVGKSIGDMQKNILMYKDYNVKNIFVMFDKEVIELSDIDSVFGELKGVFELSKIVFCIRSDDFILFDDIGKFVQKLKSYGIKKINIIERGHKITISAYDYLKYLHDENLSVVLYFTPDVYDDAELIYRIYESKRIVNPNQKIYFCFPLSMAITRNITLVE